VRHVLVLACLAATVVVTGAILDGLARRSPGPGLVLAWSDHPGPMLASLPRGQVRVVNTWLAGHLVQLHVESMRRFGAPLAATRLAIRLPEATTILAGCG